MLRAVWKSLLARKVRLLMSTFAISLGVAFVVGSLVFSAALSNGFNRLFGASVGDVVVRPAGSTTLNGDPSTRTVPASLVTRLEAVPGAARVDGNVQALGVFVVGTNHKVVGGLGAPTYGISYSDAPAGHGVPGLTLKGVAATLLDRLGTRTWLALTHHAGVAAATVIVESVP